METKSFPGKLESLKSIRDFVRRAAGEAGLDKKQTYRLSLAVDEIATNIVTHGYEEAGVEGELEVQAEITDSSLTILIEDTADLYDPQRHPLPEELDVPLEDRRSGGLGIYLAKQNVDEFHYERIKDRNRHTFTVNRSPDSTADEPNMLTKAQMIATLKGVSLFAETADEVLAKLTSALKEVRVNAGETIFEKGEIGASTFFVVSGRVRTHKGERTLDYLGKEEMFGETAAVDPETRTVSVTAVEDTLLLRLDQDSLYALMATEGGVAREVMHLLTKRLRTRVQELSDLRMRLEQVILPLGIALSEESNLDRLLERILEEAMSFCNADAGTMYVMTPDDRLSFAYMRTDSLDVAMGGTTEIEIPFAPLRLYEAESGDPNYRNVATYVALLGHSTHIPDVYDTVDFDFSATREFDKNNGYRSVSSFTVPLKSHVGDVVGVLQLFNAQDPMTGQVVPFDPYQQLVVESLASQASVALNTQMLLKRQKELLKLESDLQTARQIQADFLPVQLPRPAGWEVAAICRPAREVAGDFFDAFTLSQGRRVCFVVADVVDKGVPAALFMALTRSLTRAFAQQHYSLNWAEMLDDRSATRPARGGRRGRSIASTGTIALKNAVTLTNNYILDNHMDLNMFATLFIGMFDPRSGELAYINAGHNPPFIVGVDGTLKATLKSSGPAVGMIPGIDYEIEFNHFEPGDILFAYTDGVTEARAPDKEFYTEKRLLSLLADPASSASALVERVERELFSFIADAPRFDDITMLAVQREPDGQS